MTRHSKLKLSIQNHALNSQNASYMLKQKFHQYWEKNYKNTLEKEQHCFGNMQQKGWNKYLRYRIEEHNTTHERYMPA